MATTHVIEGRRGASGKSTKRGGDKADTSNTQARSDHAKNTKDELDDALGELNQSTNRLRRKFDPTPNYLETRVEVDRVMDDARRVNQVITRGKAGTEPERLWGALRTSINELGQTYGIARWAVDVASRSFALRLRPASGRFLFPPSTLCSSSLESCGPAYWAADPSTG